MKYIISINYKQSPEVAYQFPMNYLNLTQFNINIQESIVCIDAIDKKYDIV